MAESSKPLVLFCSTPIYGHLMPMRAIAKGLIAKGYEVTFVSASKYQKVVEEVGCDYVALEGYPDFTEADLATGWPERYSYPPGPLQLAFDVEHIFVRVIPGQYEVVQKALKMLSEKYPGRAVVQVIEGLFQGALPIIKGGLGIKPAGTLGIGVMPMCLNSIDCAAYGPGLPPDSSPEGRARNKAMSDHIQNEFFGKPQKVWEEIFKSLGAETGGARLLDAPYLFSDRFLQMCIPSAEYPRSDAPSSIRFGGGLPKGSRDASTEMPSWWNEVVENKEKKDIVFVCQGTVALNYQDLTIPTLEALEDRKNTLVVVALGKKGAVLPEDTHIPENARVADFIPYDEVLPHSAVFVTNGGYGAFQHGISNGTPIIAAAAGEDKPEVAMRAEWSGIGINLRTGSPTTEAIRTAVDEIISNPKYKIRAKEMEAEMAEFDPVSIVAQNIEDLAAGKHLN
jgi:UDP:flavonoid glycosyltransferase YjiC (YdhE family)